VDTPLQTVWSIGFATIGLELIVNVNDCGKPGQVKFVPVYCGVTFTVAMIGEVPVLMAVNGVIVPVPLAARPIPLVEFVQVYDVAFPLNIIPDVLLLLQTT
jgi:hypothetical protein